MGKVIQVDYNYYFEAFPGYEKAGKVKKAMIHCFPAEASFNFNLREGYHANNAASADDLDETERQIKKKIKRLKRKAKRSGIDLEQAIQNSSANVRRFIFDDFVYYDDFVVNMYRIKVQLKMCENGANLIWLSKII
jgi:hypothetical protein